ncbi:hypothetical protein GOV08_01185, partial [Candidatus Woesearchaeota archaeon]|nr:hypothetical protein [Candidatus Woesearchaeota archaeon]
YNKAIMDKSLFDLGIGIRFIMEIMIERNGVPDYKGISKLIDEEKFGTDKLRITGRWDSKDEIMSVFTPISSGLNTLEYINELKDESEKMLGYASHALAQTFYINENPSINNMEISKTLH